MRIRRRLKNIFKQHRLDKKKKQILHT
jgi:hypothetical protein